MSQVNADRINVGMGVKFPALTQSQINSRSTQPGDMVYNITEESFQVYNGLEGQWEIIGEGSELYDFTSVTFTPGGQTGYTGPSLAQVRSAISGNDVWKNDPSLFNVSGGKIEWTVPADADYQITAVGAQGGRSNCYGPNGGLGASMQGTFTLAVGQKLYMVIGQRGGDNCYDGGGGGATYVCTSSGGNALLVAGGGGAGSASGMNGPGPFHGHTGNTGGGTAWANGGGANQGGNGAGGPPGGGGGVTGNGGGPWGGQSFTAGSVGGGNQARGGFGGGGGGGGTNGAGGGGGYGGGASSRWSFYGAGGGSYNGGTNQNNQNSNNSNEGSITIQKL